MKIILVDSYSKRPIDLLTFECGRCGCLWISDEHHLIEKDTYCVFVSDCPLCEEKNIQAFKALTKEVGCI